MSEQHVIWCVDSSDQCFEFEQASAQGVQLSPSFVKEMMGHQPANRGLYQANYRSLHQETILERVRRNYYPSVASRLGALFAYPDTHSAEAANQHYWQGTRELFHAHMFSGSRCLLTDSAWLDCEPEAYEENAHHYFQGVLSEEPQLEMLIHGGIRIDKSVDLDDSVQIDQLLAATVQHYPSQMDSQHLPMGLL